MLPSRCCRYRMQSGKRMELDETDKTGIRRIRRKQVQKFPLMSFPLISNNQQHSTNRLYKHFRLFSFFTFRNFMEQYFQVPENGETGHFFDPAPGCPSKSILALPKSKVSQSKTTAPPPEFPVSLLGSSAPPPASPVSPPVPHSFTALAFIPLLKPAFHYPSPRFHRPRHCDPPSVAEGGVCF